MQFEFKFKKYPVKLKQLQIKSIPAAHWWLHRILDTMKPTWNTPSKLMKNQHNIKTVQLTFISSPSFISIS